MAIRETTTGDSEDGRRHPGIEASTNGGSARTDGGSARGSGRGTRYLAVGLAGAIVLWAVVDLLFGWASFAMDLPEGTEQNASVANLIAKLFGTLAILLLAADPERRRLRWLAAGFLCLTLGQALTKLVEPLTVGTPDLNHQLYDRLVMWGIVAALFVVGLLPKAAPRLPWRWLLVVFAAFVLLEAAVANGAHLLPPLVEGVGGVEEAVAGNDGPMPGLTGWHFALTSIPLGLAVAASVGALRRSRDEALAGWVVLAAVLLAGSQLHALAWPPGGGGQVLASTQVLHFLFATTVGVGGVLELRRIAAERTALAAAEREQARRLRELSVIKADFTVMIAHELGTPLAAIQGYTDMLKTGEVPPDLRTRALDAIQTETDALNALVADVRASASIEREDFAVDKAPVELDKLLEDAAAFMKAFDGGNPLKIEAEAHGRVLADAERVGQVLRNLLSNAARYSQPGSPIELRATRVEGDSGANGANGAGRVRIEVADRGRGIHPGDLDRIFEKFGRGRDRSGQRAAGAGLGLYLSRRIARAHGSDLTVRSEPGEGSVFAFELEEVVR